MRFARLILTFAMRSRSKVAIVAAVIGAAMPIAGEAKEGESFLCKIEGGGKVAEAFPEAVGVAVGSEDEGTYVMDPIINYYHGEPIQAEVKADTDRRISLRWKVKVKDEENGIALFDLWFDLTILKGPMTARLRLKATGDTYEFSAPGTCTREKW